METKNYPEDFWRGISNKTFLSEGHVLPSAFQFDDEVRADGYRELSINWNDCEDALITALNQRRENGNLQFKAGVAKLNLEAVNFVLSNFKSQNQFTYERREVEGNAYHGNLLILGSLEKAMRTMISNGLALVAGTNVVPQMDQTE